MIEYIIAGVATFVFTTVLTIAGLGAAFILIPVLLALKVPLLTAMSIALLLNAISMALASISYAREKLVVYKIAIPMIIAATILSPLGAMTAEHLPKNILLWLFAGFLVFAGSMMLFYKPKQKEIDADVEQSLPIGVATGSAAGFFGGLLGVGGGNFIVPVLVWGGLDPKKAAATTALVVVFSSFAGFLGHVSLGNMDYTLLGICVVGSILGALLGAHLMKKTLSRSQVKAVIGLILFMVAAKIILDLLTASG
ncbi:MAG: sulfite exporter TauE/SafE family protein [Candidatus Micrarchaeia archaeon]